MLTKNFKATNVDIAEAFGKIAEILEIQGENKFRVRAYERAAQTVGGMAKDVGEIYHEGQFKALKEIPGIGDDLALKIEEMLTTGKLKFLHELAKKVPQGVIDIMAVEGMGPKKTKLVWKKFGVKNVKELEELAKSGKLNKLDGWGEKSVANVLHNIELSKNFVGRLPLAEAMNIAETIVGILKKSDLCVDIEIAGSLRRMKDTIGDIDILVTSNKPEEVTELFTTMPLVKEIMAKSLGSGRSTVLLKAGIEADLRVLDPEQFGAGLYYFTGSKQHHIVTRTMAIKKHITVSEYGVYKGTKEHKGKLIAARTEEDIFKAIGLPYIPPEIREASGEIEAALAHKLPKLIEEKDIKGDLHLHSSFSDGSHTMLEMAEGAKRAGFEYIAITDHASSMGMVRGIKEKNIDEYLEMIDEVRKKVHGIHILSGTEVDIEEDGSLYLPNELLKKLDWVVASVHSHFKQSEAVMTKRLMKAIENPYVKVIAHPFTRKILSRAPIEFNFTEVAKHAKSHGVALEINASPDRLDLSDVYIRQAKEIGTMLTIDSDSHDKNGFNFRFGVAQARRGWCEKGDILNTQSFADFHKRLNR
jgi:DNA polymerase (family 10)